MHVSRAGPVGYIHAGITGGVQRDHKEFTYTLTHGAAGSFRRM